MKAFVFAFCIVAVAVAGVLAHAESNPNAPLPKTKRPTVVRSAWLIALSVGFILYPVTSFAAEQRPNILFILTENQGALLNYPGTPGLQTPHMDTLARSGVYFRLM